MEREEQKKEKGFCCSRSCIVKPLVEEAIAAAKGTKKLCYNHF